ncbi:MAG TPA: hypothetical protein VN577_19900 [Terriglobales bacterium]|nr:hypothetical protein [Terriglobales bacterium]
MSRPAGVTVIATFSLLGSLLLFGLSVLMLLVYLFAPMLRSNVNTSAAPPQAAFLVSFFFLLAPAVWGLTSSIGLYRSKRWARISTLIFSGILIFMGVLTPLFLLAIPLPETPRADPAIMSRLKVFLTVFYLLLASIGAWWMIYLTRPKVKECFMTGVAQGEPSRRPTSVSVIAWIMIVSACFVPINLVMSLPAMIFGSVVTGWYAKVLMILYSAALLLGGIGLLKLNSFARNFTIGYFLFGIVNGLVSYFRPGSEERMRQLLEAMPASFQTPNPPSFNPFIFSMMMIPLMLVPVYFLVRNRRAFEPVSVPPPPPAAAD